MADLAGLTVGDELIGIESDIEVEVVVDHDLNGLDVYKRQAHGRAVVDDLDLVPHCSQLLGDRLARLALDLDVYKRQILGLYFIVHEPRG